MTSKKCHYCNETAIVRIPYIKLRLCKDHFIQYFEQKFVKTIESFNLFKGIRKVVLGFSGGKDSSALLYLLHKYSELFNLEIYPIHIDLGIEDYSKQCLTIVDKVEGKLGIKCITVKVKDYGFTISDVKRLESRIKRPICSVCGIVKRYILNKIALELKVDAVITAHNLNDIAQYLLVNYMSGNVDGLVKITPKIPSIGNAVCRLKPLFLIPENEIQLYVELLEIPHVNIKCPYFNSSKKPLQQSLRELLIHIESKYPGTLINMVMNYLRNIHPILNRHVRHGDVKNCLICGMPTQKDICAFCKIRMKIQNLNDERSSSEE